MPIKLEARVAAPKVVAVADLAGVGECVNLAEPRLVSVVEKKLPRVVHAATAAAAAFDAPAAESKAVLLSIQ